MRPSGTSSAVERLTGPLEIMVRLRWGGVAFCLLQIFLVNQLFIDGVLPWVLALSIALTALLAVGNLAIRRALRRLQTGRAARRLAVVSLILDSAVVKGFVFLYVYDADAAMFALLYVLVLEAAILFQLRGAVIIMATSTVFYVLRDVYGTVALGNPFYPPAITFRVTIGWLIAGVAGMMASSLVRQRDELETAKADVEAYADRLSATNVELEAARVRAEDSTRSKSAFLASMSHELRTPLNAVIGMSHLLESTPLDSEQSEYVGAIRSSAEVLLNTINDVLDFSKVEAGHLELDRRPEDLRHLVETTLDVIAPLASQKRIDLVYHLDEDVPAAVVTDGHRLRQVLVNLLTNGVKFTDAGEVGLLVSREVDAEGRHRVVFEVRDTGIGIPPDAHAALFESFTQVDASTSRRFGGTGLGLAISQRLVGLLGGVIEVESEVGAGSRFRFSIPADVAEVAAPSVEATSDQLQGRSVLIVNPNPTDRRLLDGFVTAWGMVPATASGVAEALEAVETRGFDVVLIDDAVDGHGGRDLADRLAAHPTAGGVPRILLARLGAPEVSGGQSSATAAPFTASVTKPVKQSSLLDLLVTILADRSVGAASAPSSTLDPTFGSRHPLRILAAEDNPTNQRLMVRLLERLGYDPVVAADGEEAVAAVEAQPFDLVLMDVQMPQLDGLGATRRIRSLDVAQPWIVAVTANTTEEDRQACRDAGMDDYLSKPLRPDRLLAALERAHGQLSPAVLTETPDGPNPSEAVASTVVDVAALRQLLDLTGEDRPFVESLLSAFPDQLDGVLVDIRAATEPAEVRRHAHSLKSSAASLGAASLAACASRLEDAAAAADIAMFPALIAQLEEVAASTVQAMVELADW